MTATKPSRIVLAQLRESTVALLMARRLREDETLDAVSARLASSGLPNLSQPIALPPLTSRTRATGKYGLELLGEPLRASTLAELFGALIDRLAELDPEAVEKLSTIRSTKRGFVSRDKNAIHPGRPDLPLRRTRSGWWISANIGIEDLERALRRTCEANDLVYCRDIRFLVNSQ